MADTKTQTYANHAHRPTLSLFAGLFGFSALIILAIHAFRQPTPEAGGLVLLTLSVLILVVMSRFYIVKLQDRIIRLEMQTRLARLGVPVEFGRLSMRQVVALRFASDAELPALCARAVAENLPPDQIKRAVADWQGDFHRT